MNKTFQPDFKKESESNAGCMVFTGLSPPLYWERLKEAIIMTFRHYPLNDICHNILSG